MSKKSKSNKNNKKIQSIKNKLVNGELIKNEDALYINNPDYFLTFSDLEISDGIDIIIVTFIIYKALQFLRDTRAEQLIKGIAVFLVALGVAKLLDLKALMWLLDTVYINLIVVVVVLFQPELRSILEYVGRGSVKHFGKLVNRTQVEETPDHSVDAICSACQSMQVEKIGALIVIERDTALNEIHGRGYPQARAVFLLMIP